MRAKSIILLVLALGCGLVASIGITQVMAKRSGAGGAITGEVQKIFIAMNDIPMGDPITPQMIKLEEWPKDKVQPGALTKLEDIEGRRPKAKIFAGTPILDKQLLAKGASDHGATGLIPKGYRVVSVKVDAVSGSASLIRPGDRVDVLVHVEKNETKGIGETSTRTVLQDIKVFAVDDVFALESNEKNDAKATSNKTISLLVKPDQAEMVTLATELGKVRLVMRSPEDDEQPTASGANPQQIFGGSTGADRKNENLTQEKTAPVNNEAFLQFLAAQKQQAETKPAVVAEPTTTTTTQNWTVRVLAGSQVSDMVLQSSQTESAGGGSVGASHWTLQSPSGEVTAPSGSPSKAKHQAAEPSETPQETPVSTGAAPADGPAPAGPAASNGPSHGSSKPEGAKKTPSPRTKKD